MSSMPASISSLSLRRYAPILRFSFTVRLSNTRRPSGTMAMPSATTCWALKGMMSRPRKLMAPEAVFTRPLMARSVVLLPAPLAPISVTIWPCSTSKEMPLRASMPP